MDNTLQLVKDITSDICITILLNTHRTKPDKLQDRIVLKNLIQQASSRLLTFETKEKMSKKKKGAYNGENNPFFGKTHSKETIEKILATRLKNKQLKNHKNGKTSIISKLT